METAGTVIAGTRRSLHSSTVVIVGTIVYGKSVLGWVVCVLYHVSDVMCCLIPIGYDEADRRSADSE